MRSVLKIPSIYLLSQFLIGAMLARRRMLQNYSGVRSDLRVLDLGCGPGYVTAYLPNCAYVGFDLDERYIRYAKKHYGERHAFHCRAFDSDQLDDLGEFDLVLMNGLLHHLPDDQACELIELSRSALKTNGLLLTLDGCYQDGQSSIARYLLDKDRGAYVRKEAGYRALVESVFEKIEIFIRSDFSWIPYTWIVMRCVKI